MTLRPVGRPRSEPNQPLLDLLFEALKAEHGMIFKCEDAELLRTKFYALARDNGLKVSISLSPTNPATELWVMKRKDDAPAE